MFKTREKLTVDRFIKKSREKHGDKFDYRLIKCIKNNRTKVVIVCNVCGGPFIVNLVSIILNKVQGRTH